MSDKTADGEEMRAIGQRLRQAREVWSRKKRLAEDQSIPDLAAKARVGATSLRRWEDGVAPRVLGFLRVCNVLQAPLSCVLGVDANSTWPFHPISEDWAWIGDRMSCIRERAGVGVQELADAAGLHRTLLTRWEAGEREPLLPSFLRVVEALRVAPEVVACPDVLLPAMDPRVAARLGVGAETGRKRGSRRKTL